MRVNNLWLRKNKKIKDFTYVKDLLVIQFIVEDAFTSETPSGFHNQIGADGIRPKAQQNAHVVHLSKWWIQFNKLNKTKQIKWIGSPGFVRFDDEGHFHAESFFDQMMMDGPQRQ